MDMTEKSHCEGQTSLMNDDAEWRPPTAPPKALASILWTSADTCVAKSMNRKYNERRSATGGVSTGTELVMPSDGLARYAMFLTGRCRSRVTEDCLKLKTSKIWRCCECQRSFPSKDALAGHCLQTQHGVQFAGKRKGSKRGSNTNTSGIGRSNVEKYCCIQCGARYRSTQALGLHNAVRS